MRYSWGFRNSNDSSRRAHQKHRRMAHSIHSSNFAIVTCPQQWWRHTRSPQIEDELRAFAASSTCNVHRFFNMVDFDGCTLLNRLSMSRIWLDLNLLKICLEDSCYTPVASKHKDGSMFPAIAFYSRGHYQTRNVQSNNGGPSLATFCDFDPVGRMTTW